MKRDIFNRSYTFKEIIFSGVKVLLIMGGTIAFLFYLALLVAPQLN